MDLLNKIPFTKLLNIFLSAIIYFIALRIISSITLRIFPSYSEDIEINKKRKYFMALEVLGEIGIIAVVIFVFRNILNYYDSIFFSSKYASDYEKFLLFVVGPAIFAGPSDLKKKIDFAFGDINFLN